MAWCAGTASCRAGDIARVTHCTLPTEMSASKLSMRSQSSKGDQTTTAHGSSNRSYGIIEDSIKWPPSSFNTQQAPPWTTDRTNIDVHTMVKWFQEEVVNRLQKLDARLDDIAVRLEPKAASTTKKRAELCAGSIRCPGGDKATMDWPDDGGSFSVRTKKLDAPNAGFAKMSEDVGEAIQDGGINSPSPRLLSKNRNSTPRLPTRQPAASSQAKKDETPRTEDKKEEKKSPQDLAEMFASGSSANPAGLAAEFASDRSPSDSKSGWRETVLNFLDDAESGPLAFCYANVMPVIGMASAFVTILQSTQNPPLCGIPAAIVETMFDFVFALELAIRFVVSPVKATFFRDVHNVIDLIGVVPLALRLSTQYLRPCNGDDGGLVDTILLAINPVIRILKCVRRFEKFELILSAFKNASEALPICLFSLLLLTMTFSTCIFLVEPRDNIPTLPDAMWLTIVTATTVGYGDVTPQSTAGHLFTTMLVVSSVLYLSMPLGIVGQSFTEVWQERDRVLLRRRTLDSLRKWGYTASDIPTLFDMFDNDGNRELDFQEFKKMFSLMKVGLSHGRLAALFESIDKDGGGTIDDREFVKGLFGPETFHQVYLADAGGNEDGHGRRMSLTRAMTNITHSISNITGGRRPSDPNIALP